MTTSNEQRRKFRETVDSWITAAINGGCSNFVDLIERLPSVYPKEITESLERLQQLNTHDPFLLERLLNGSKEPTVFTQRSVDSCVLPPPHPLDFEWRFSPRSGDLLLELAEDRANQESSIVLLGTPSVFHRAIENRTERKIQFLGENNIVLRVLKEQLSVSGLPFDVLDCRDLHAIIGTAGAVIVDPPWYPDFVRSFLISSAAICAANGYVILSLPPKGTRPSAENDRAELITEARNIGLTLTHEASQAIRYDTPFFERNALNQVGITNVPKSWRKGDLLIFRKTMSSTGSFALTAPSTDWKEFVCNGIRIKVRRGSSQASGPIRLQGLVPNDVLPSVSRRVAIREEADIWTSGNRIFSCNRPDVIRKLLQDFSHVEKNPAFFKDDDWIELQLKLSKMIETEAQEMRDAKERPTDVRFGVANTVNAS